MFQSKLVQLLVVMGTFTGDFRRTLPHVQYVAYKFAPFRFKNLVLILQPGFDLQLDIFFVKDLLRP